MKYKITLILLFLALGFSFGQTTLTEGDIAITGVNADNPDEFSFVLLTDVLNTTQINFTDKSWLAVGGFRLNAAGNPAPEGIVTWTATSDLPCGTEIIITDTGANTHSSTSGTAIEFDDIGFNLAAAGDVIIAYQGALETPTFLYAVYFGNANGWTDGTDANNSAVPAGLTAGVNAIDLGNYDNNNYRCTITNNQSLILEAVATVNATNWYQTNNNNAGRPVLGGCTYTCSAAGSCPTTVTWNGAWSGTPDLTTEVIIAANYNTSLGSFKACSLTINTGSRLTVNNGTYVEVENNVIVDGQLYVQTQGNFVQNDNAGTFTNNGASLVNKSTAPKADWYYYTYWSSPVFGETIAGAFPNTDADRRFSFNASNFIDADADDIDDNGDDWTVEAAGNIMTPGVGYAATSSRFAPYPNVVETATFNGSFNTGDVTIGIVYNAINTLGSWNFIGNPYPSAIDFIAFQSANSTVIDGAAYFWSQSLPPDNTNPGNEVYNFNQNDYATFTVGTGGAAGASGIIPNQFIPSGQGFFIPSLANGNVTFTNAMRMSDGTSNNQFFRNSNSKKSSTKLENKLWVNLTSDNGVFNQVLIAYVDGATNNNDGLSYDAPRRLSSDFAATLYSTIENSGNDKFVIQGKAINSLTLDEVIPLGFSTRIDIPTIYTLSIAQLQGDFINNNLIYLKDNLLNKIHSLKSGDYNFTSEVGEFNDRFEIIFRQDALSVNDFALDKNALSIIEHKNGDIQFKLNASHKMNNIKIIDLQGRILYDFKVDSKDEVLKLSNLSNAPYIAKITLDNNYVITKKAIKKY